MLIIWCFKFLVHDNCMFTKKTFFLFSILFVLIFAVLFPLSASHANNGEEIVYITDTGDHYHTEGCRYLYSKHETTLLSAVRRGYTPCSQCHPPILDFDPGPIEQRHKRQNSSNSSSSSSNNTGTSASSSKNKDSSTGSTLGKAAALLFAAGVFIVPFSLASIETKKTGKRKAYRKNRSR